MFLKQLFQFLFLAKISDLVEVKHIPRINTPRSIGWSMPIGRQTGVTDDLLTGSLGNIP